MRSPMPDPVAAVFGYSPAFRAMMLGCLLGFLIFAGFGLSVVLSLSDPRYPTIAGHVLGVTMFGTFAVLSLIEVLKTWDKVAVDAEGVRYIPRKGDATFIAWADIATVVTNDVMQRIVLVDASGQKTIRLKYQLDDFARLHDIVLARTALVPPRPADATTVFHRSRIEKGIYVVSFGVACGLGLLAYRQGSPGAALLVFAFAMVFPVLVALDPSRLTITPTAVEIAFPVHTRMIGFADIGSVELVNVPRTGNVRPTVVLHPRGGKPVLLSHFRGGALALHAALRAAWVSAGQT